MDLGLPAAPLPARRPDGSASPSRITSLDGLRGAAALVVVIYHVFLVQPSLAAPHLDPNAPLGAVEWLATFTPLHLMWAGPEAVFVFFVLSGLVLALPVADTGRLDLRDYYRGACCGCTCRCGRPSGWPWRGPPRSPAHGTTTTAGG